MNRRRMRILIAFVVLLALFTGIGATLIAALRAHELDRPVALLPGVTLTPQELRDAGLGITTVIQYAPSSFMFFPDQSAEPLDLAALRGGVTVEFRDGGELTFLGGRFPGASETRDQAYAWYRSKATDTGLADDQPPAVIGHASAMYQDSSATAVLVCADDTVFTLLYAHPSPGGTDTSSRLAASIEGLARLIVSRL